MTPAAPQEVDMGLLNSVLSALGTDQHLQGVASGDALQAVVAMLARTEPGGGGLDGLVRRFEKGGLGELVASWIGTGRNLPVSPAQLSAVLGEEQLGQFAHLLGVSRGDAALQLSHVLPQVVDRLTPEGRLPDTAVDGLGDIGSVLERFTPR
jgi:uncharacterized protein YidB (DUF937 family)